MNKKWINYIDKLASYLNENNLLEGIYHGAFFFDEPSFYYYSATIKNSREYTSDFYTPIHVIYSGGNSFFSKELALLKCLSEAVERISQESFRTNTILYDTYRNIKNKGIDPSYHIKDPSVQTELLGWIEGKELQTGEKVLLPAQYVHYSYLSYRKETQITHLISTGGATGWTHEETLLAGIYEVIERDAFMTAYYLKAPVSKINIELIIDPQVAFIKKKVDRYKLEWHLFDMTNDLGIPVFTSIIIDRTGMGPAVTVGASCGLDIMENIIKSVSEALMSRPWIRAYTTIPNNTLLSKQKSTQRIESRIDRAMYWYPLHSIKKLSFWIDQKPSMLKSYPTSFDSKKSELSYVLNKIKRKGNSYYYCDISHEKMKKKGFRVYKVISPELQGLSLQEDKLLHNHKRLSDVASYFKLDKYSINSYPHPFL